MKKVVIGIVSKHNRIDCVRPDTFIRDEIKDAVFYNNAVAIGLLPPNKEISLVNQSNEKLYYESLDNMFSEKEKENFITQIQLCDGVILSGGGESDAYEMWVARYCYENDIPILGICAGANNLIRGVGGSTKKVDKPDLHSQPQKDHVHYINIDKNSKFFTFVKTEKILVNSRHKNTIDNPAGSSVAAYDEFGNIEVTEDKSKRCFVGMRFHPESLYLTDREHNKIFEEFISICKNEGT